MRRYSLRVPLEERTLTDLMNTEVSSPESEKLSIEIRSFLPIIFLLLSLRFSARPELDY